MRASWLRRRARALLSSPGESAWQGRWEDACAFQRLAASLLSASDRSSDLELALALTERSLAFWPYFLAHVATRIRILLALNRPLEAYREAAWAAALAPEWDDLAPILSSDDYRTWASGREPRLPAGLASTGAVEPSLSARLHGPGNAPISSAERAHLLRCRVGDSEWLRARNAALIALLAKNRIPAKQLAGLEFRAVDPVQGVLHPPDSEPVRLGEQSAAKLRHWMLYNACNHPVACRPPSAVDPRAPLFIDEASRPLDHWAIERLLAHIGERTGLDFLHAGRLRIVQPGSPYYTDGPAFPTLDEAKAGALERTTATVLQGFTIDEDSWIPYTYRGGESELVFLYLTPCDESHRIYGGHPREWYDELVAGTRFELVCDRAEPKRHRVLDPRFARLNGAVSFAGYHCPDPGEASSTRRPAASRGRD